MARAALLGRLTWLIGQLAAVREETATARTLVLDVPGWAGHLPGQHVDVRLTAEDGYSTERSYSIASAPGGTRIGLTIQRLDDGEVSPYLTEVLTPGNPLELRGPIGGYFAWHPHDPQPVLLTGGGSGVVPLMAMARTRAATRQHRPDAADLLHPQPRHLAVRHRAAAPRNPGHRPGHRHRLHPGSAGRMGRPRRAPGRAAPFSTSRDRRRCFICGPTGFVESTARLLAEQGIADRQIRTGRSGPSGGTP
jgi:ferredoxin-NADP reductase